jgi:predicted  nucleic acid-binding Zn-ribbon protein
MPPPFALFLSCAVALPLACGCQDSEAKRRAEVQQIITAATAELDEAAAIHVDIERESQLRQKLNQLISKLADTADAEPGQRAAASRLAGNAHRLLSSIDLVQADRLEADHRARRWVVGGMIDAALELDTVATAEEAIDTSAQQDALSDDREAASEELREHSQHMATLDGPIEDLKRQNRDDRAQADRLREEASQLRREAADMGSAEGYSTFEHSLHLDRQADRVEYEIAQRELELRFILEPEHTVAQSRIEQAQYRLDNADSARQSLQDVEQTMSAEARSTRAGVAELGEKVEAALSEIEQSSAGPLTELYDRAGSNLERAASKAKSAATMARGEGTDAARVEAAWAYQGLGDMYWAKARGLEQDITLRQRLADNASALGGVSGTGSSLAGLREAHKEAMSQAITAYGSAQEALEQVSGRSARSRLEALKADISLLQTAASGQAVDLSGAAGGDSPAREGRPSPAPASGSGGANSPQALIEALQGATDLESFTGIQLDLTHIELKTPVARQIYDASIVAGRAMAELDKAMREKLGSGLDTPEVSLGEVSGDRGTMTVTMFGAPQPVGLIRINGMWYVDGTAQFDAQIAQAGAMGIDEAAINAGEFSSPPEVMMALGEAMQGLQ